MKENRRYNNEQPSEGLFVGRNAVMELLRSGRTVDRIYMRNDQADGVLGTIRARANEKKIPLVDTDQRKLDKLADGLVHQGVIAVAAETDYLTVEERLELHELLKKYNMIELFYDDMRMARDMVAETIK